MVVGSIIWVDEEATMTLRSTAITEYIVPEVQPEQGTSRQITGTMSVDGEGEYPFELEVIDVDLPGSGKDTVDLKVGDGARTSENATPASGSGFSYAASGTVVTGDIQELDRRDRPGNGGRPAGGRLTESRAHRNLRMCVATATTSPCWLVAVTAPVVMARDTSAATIS